MSTEQEFEAFQRLEKGSSSLRREAAKLGTSKSTIERRFSDYIEQRTEKLRSSLAGLVSEVSKTEKKLVEIKQEYAHTEQEEGAKLRKKLELIDNELRAKERLLQACGRKNLPFARCLELVESFEDLSTEVLKRRKTLQRWDAAISEKQRQHDELEQRIPKLEESERIGKYALQAAQKLYFDAVNSIQFLREELSSLEQEVNALNGVVMVLSSEEAKARTDLENVVSEKNEIIGQIVRIQEAITRAKGELKRAEIERDSMLASVGDWIRVKADERVNEAAEVLRLRLAVLGAQ